jgi:hypothetical protein
VTPALDIVGDAGAGPLQIGVVAANTHALRFYQRRGLSPRPRSR